MLIKSDTRTYLDKHHLINFIKRALTLYASIRTKRAPISANEYEEALATYKQKGPTSEPADQLPPNRATLLSEAVDDQNPSQKKV